MGNYYQEQVKVIGLAVIGSGMIMQGLGQYAGGFPPMFAPSGSEALKPTYAFAAYGVGFIIVALAGRFYQNKKQAEES